MQPIVPTPEVRLDSSVDLLRKAQSGDEDALNRLLARYLPRLQYWATGRLPGLLRTMLDTGDLVQEAMINALPHLKTIEIRSERALQFYLQRAVKNRIIDLHKRARCRPERDNDQLAFVAVGGPSPQQAAIAAEEVERYDRALGFLTKREQHLIMLRLELEFTYEEIATELGMRSDDAARMAVSRALVRLADKMGRGLQRGSARRAARKARRGFGEQ